MDTSLEFKYSLANNALYYNAYCMHMNLLNEWAQALYEITFQFEYYVQLMHTNIL